MGFLGIRTELGKDIGLGAHSRGSQGHDHDNNEGTTHRRPPDGRDVTPAELGMHE